MVIKIYISGISGSKEVKKRQQRVLLILDSKNVKYEVVDIAEPGAEEAKDFVQNNSTSMGCTISDPNPRHPLPPQIFNDDDYCGDYDQFDMANEIDEMEKFLKLEVPNPDVDITSNAEIQLKNGEVTPDETKSEAETKEDEVKENEVPNEQEKTESEEQTNDAEAKDTEEIKETEDTQENEESKAEAEDTKETKSEENSTEGAGDKEEKDEENSKNEDEKADDA